MIGLIAVVLAAGCGGTSESDPPIGGISPTGGQQSDEVVAPETIVTEGAVVVPTGEAVGFVEEEPPVADTPAEPVESEGGADDAATDIAPPTVTHANPQVAAAMTDLVDRVGVAADAIAVVSVEEVTWPDGSIGCPEPGMRYTQALVNGTRIILQANGADYEYHSGGGRDVFYCQNPTDPVTGGGHGDV